MNENILLKEFKLNNILSLKNRIAMAPMTRDKADDDLVPTQAMADYYARRAEAGLIITEGIIIGLDSVGYRNVPGIFTAEQVKGWRRVTEAVHRNNGLIFAQIWHVGRVSHPSYLKGELPISASATKMMGRMFRSEGLNYGLSRQASIDDIKHIIDAFAQAAKNAIVAGFDGVEIHGANGYLVDQFLHHHTNHRTDEYGGSPENMARFALDVVKACGETIGYERVGLRLSPGAYLHEIVGDARDADVFKYLLAQLNQYPLAYVHVGNFDDSAKFAELNDTTMSAFIRQHYAGVLMGCGSYTVDAAQQSINDGHFNLIAFGRPFIANSDLVQRLQQKQTLRPFDGSMLAELI